MVPGARMKRRFLLCLITGLICLSLADCARSLQQVRIAVQDYRFDPALIQIQAARPVRLVLTNEGREIHHLQSDLFSLAGAPPHPDPASSPPSSGAFPPNLVKLHPGQSVELTLHLLPGTYLLRCVVRGHAGMAATLVVS